MDPWTDDTCRRAPSQPLAEHAPYSLCAQYPSCLKEERKLLNEVRAMGSNVPVTIKLSNGMRATDFCLQYIMNNHFKPQKNISRKTK